MVRKILADNKLVGVVPQKSPKDGDPYFKQLYKYGVLGQLQRMVEGPAEQKAVLTLGLKRFKIVEEISDSPFLLAKVEYLDEIYPKENDYDFLTIIESVRDISRKILELIGKDTIQAIDAIQNIDDPEFLINLL